MFKRASAVLAFAIVASLPGVLAAPPALGQTVCTGLIVNQQVQGDLIVPPEGNCTLFSSTVTGSVIIQPGGRFTADTARINGNISGTGVRQLSLTNVFVGGSVSVNGTTEAGFVTICRSNIRGNLVIDNASTIRLMIIGPQLGCGPNGGNTIGGHLLLRNNRTGGLQVQNNVIGGSLQCFGNVPPPTVANNSALFTSGQCAPGGTTAAEEAAVSAAAEDEGDTTAAVGGEGESGADGESASGADGESA